MTTELEKQFFSVFDIKPKYQDTCTVEEKYWQNEELANEFGTFDQYMNAKCGNQENCTTQCSCAYQKEIYPQITDKQYLKLICIANHEDVYIELVGTDVETMKNNLLENFIHFKRIIPKHQVQAIFEEER